MPRARRKTFPQDCAPRRPHSQAPEGGQSPFIAMQLQQSNFSYLRQTQGQSNTLTAICSRCGARHVGEFVPQPSSIEQSCTGVILTRPVWTMPHYKIQPCISDATQVICHSVENVETHCQSGTPLLDLI